METSAHIKYLLANEQDNRWGVVVTTTGYQIIEPQTSYPPSNHPVRYLFSVEKGRLLNEYQLIYISRGDGQFVSASHKETSFEGGGKFILLFPGEWHSYRPSPKTGWHEYWIGFTGPDIDRKVGAKFLDPHRPLFNVGYHEDIINLYKLALRTAQEQGSGFQQILAGIVNLLLGFAYAEHMQTALEDMQVAAQLNEAKIIMQDNFNRNLSCQEVAARICMSYSRFRRLFRQYVGFAPAQYLLELKINKSKELLTNSALTCQEIAFESGFEYPSHFNIAFKKKTGITPNQYRDLTQGRLPGDSRFDPFVKEPSASSATLRTAPARPFPMSRNRGKTPASLPCRAAGTSRNRRGDAAFDDPPASREKRRGLLPRKPCDFRRSRTYAADAPAGERIGFAPLLFSMEKRPRSIVIVPARRTADSLHSRPAILSGSFSEKKVRTEFSAEGRGRGDRPKRRASAPRSVPRRFASPAPRSGRQGRNGCPDFRSPSRKRPRSAIFSGRRRQVWNISLNFAGT